MYSTNIYKLVCSSHCCSKLTINSRRKENKERQKEASKKSDGIMKNKA